MEMLDSMDGLEGPPIFKPNNLHSTVKPEPASCLPADQDLGKDTHALRRQVSAKRLLHIVVDFFPRRIGKVTGGWVLCQLKVGPNHHMDDAILHAVRPVIQQDLKILCIGLVRTSHPLESIIRAAVEAATHHQTQRAGLSVSGPPVFLRPNTVSL
jgi:hypothetical protein